MARYNVDLQDNEGNAYQIMANPDSVAEFSPAANRENIRSGETYRVIFGKIMKYLSEVGNAAYVGLANNCTTTIAGFALDARQGKELMDRVNELNRDLNALNDDGAIKGLDAREDGVYITYVPSSGADSVTKKLGDALESTDGAVLMIHNHMNAKDTFQCMFNKEYIGQNSASIRKFDVLRSGAYTYVFTHSPTGGSGSVSKILVNDKQIDYMEFTSGPKSKSGSISLNMGDTVELVTGSYNSGHITNASMVLKFDSIL